MKIGCSVLNEKELEIAADTGYDYVEFKGRFLAGLSEKEVDRISRILGSYNLLSYGINAYCGPELQMSGELYDPEKTRSYAMDMANKVSKLGTKIVGVGSPFSRRISPGDDRGSALLQMQEFLEITARCFEPYGITVCLEPLAPVFCDLVNDTVEAGEMIDKINSCHNLGIVIDYYSMELSGEDKKDISPFFDRIKHVHMSDDLGDIFKRSYLLPEKRHLHRERIFFLKEIGYKGNVTLEMDMPADKEKAAESLRSFMIKNGIIE